jgi:hypothetical protein
VSRGIGCATTEELQARGAAFGAARNVADVPATAGLFPMAADVTQETARQALLEAALARHGLAVGRAKMRRPTPKGGSGVAPGYFRNRRVLKDLWDKVAVRSFVCRLSVLLHGVWGEILQPISPPRPR